MRNLSNLYDQLNATSGQLSRYAPNAIWEMAQKLPGPPIENAQWLDKLPKQARTVRNWCYFHDRTCVENLITGFANMTRDAKEDLILSDLYGGHASLITEACSLRGRRHTNSSGG